MYNDTMKTIHFISIFLLSAPVLAQNLTPQNNTKKDATTPYQAREVRNTLQKKSKDLQACWLGYLDQKKAKKESVKTVGRIKVDWFMDKDGTIRKKKVDIVENSFADTAAGEKFGECLVEKVKKIEFPETPDGKGQYIEYTFSFATEEKLKEMREKPIEIIKTPENKVAH